MPKARKSPAGDVKGYAHDEATVLMRPDVGTQAQFRKKKPPATYRYANLAGAVSAPFEPGDERRIAVKVIDDRGNELMVDRKLE